MTKYILVFLILPFSVKHSMLLSISSMLQGQLARDSRIICFIPLCIPCFHLMPVSYPQPSALPRAYATLALDVLFVPLAFIPCCAYFLSCPCVLLHAWCLPACL